jgi:steroid 5-alpha reductase family enzyme
VARDSQLSIKKFRDFVERIESKAPPKRLQRSPFIFSVALLYLGMAAPLVLSARYAAAAPHSSLLICKLALGAMALGGFIEAVGDFQKSYYKARAPDRWVDRGLYAWMRHPNYTGEQLLWAGSLMAGLACAMPEFHFCWPWVVGAVLGCAGIQFTLMMATTLLEKKQHESYGNDIAFRGYTAGTWVGFTLPGKKP